MTHGTTIGLGDVVWMDLDPTRGREQRGEDRPFLILSDHRLVATRRIVIGVPLTTTDRGWPSHVNLAEPGERPSVAMCEQIRALSVERMSRYGWRVAPDRLADVQRTVRFILGL